MPLSTICHNRMLNTVIRDQASTVTLLNTTNLETAAAPGDSTVTLGRPVAVGDYISLNGNGTREVFEVSGVDGTTATLGNGATVANSHPVNSPVGHAPKAVENITEADTNRVSIAWNDAGTEKISANTNTDIKFSVQGGNEIGGFAVFDANGVMLGSFLTGDIEGFGAAGDYLLTNADVTLSS